MADTEPVLYEVSGSSATEAGNWFQIKSFHPERTHIPVIVDISSGTATVEIQARNHPDDNPAVLQTVEDSDTQPSPHMLAHFGQFRVNVTAASAADIRVTVGGVVIDLGA